MSCSKKRSSAMGAKPKPSPARDLLSSRCKVTGGVLTIPCREAYKETMV
jgi:hypothetical protein